MSCAQVQNYIKKHGQTLLATGKDLATTVSIMPSVVGTVPGYACTTDEAYCYVGWWCDYNYPATVNPNTHDQGAEFCHSAKIRREAIAKRFFFCTFPEVSVRIRRVSILVLPACDRLDAG